ncbi:unnamed protein product [Acanthocheilonema viteae]|uniref:Uncharacterized protein n=1 Tax=Acanthocheilonema viteae TaxID=6277 RepID=A0A498SCH9_ACAVI|nr:unnamed protein product [Acanthocheilonema viteae]
MDECFMRHKMCVIGWILRSWWLEIVCIVQLFKLILGAQQKSGVEIAKTILQTKRKMSNNENTASEKANVAVSSVQTLNWDSSMNDWMDYGNENHRDSGTSSSDGMPTSDAPTSSTTSSSISIFDALLQVKL